MIGGVIVNYVATITIRCIGVYRYFYRLEPPSPPLVDEMIFSEIH